MQGMSKTDQLNQPMVSIGIPNYNYAHYILETLHSIAEQTYENVEIIIVDDCSTDNSISVIEAWMRSYQGQKKVSLFRNERNMGLTKSCNILLRHATGKYFQPLDADDILMPDKIERQVRLLEVNEDAAFVYSNAIVINENSIETETYFERIKYNKDTMPSGMIQDAILKFNFIPLPTVLLNTAKVLQVGGFDENLHVQDYYMWLALSADNKVLYINAITAKYRVHAKSMGINNATSTKSEDSILTLKYRYFSHAKGEVKETIKRNIQHSAVYLFQYGYPTAKKWLKVAWQIHPTFKTFLYHFISRIGLPYSVIGKFKTAPGKLS